MVAINGLAVWKLSEAGVGTFSIRNQAAFSVFLVSLPKRIWRAMSNLKDKYINPLTDLGFKKLFGTELDQESLKYYRDLKNVVDTSWEEGKAEGLAEGMLTVARQMKAEGLPIEQIMRFTGLSRAEVEGL